MSNPRSSSPVSRGLVIIFLSGQVLLGPTIILWQNLLIDQITISPINIFRFAGFYRFRNVPAGWNICVQASITCESYRYKPTLQEDMQRADLVISHAGAGSIMEALGEFHREGCCGSVSPKSGVYPILTSALVTTRVVSTTVLHFWTVVPSPPLLACSRTSELFGQSSIPLLCMQRGTHIWDYLCQRSHVTPREAMLRNRHRQYRDLSSHFSELGSNRGKVIIFTAALSLTAYQRLRPLLHTTSSATEPLLVRVPLRVQQKWRSKVELISHTYMFEQLTTIKSQRTID